MKLSSGCPRRYGRSRIEMMLRRYAMGLKKCFLMFVAGLLVCASSAKSETAAKTPSSNHPEIRWNEWGKPTAGVTIRLGAAKDRWAMNEIPELTVDLNNKTGRSLAVRRLPYCEVEVDGVWYVPVIRGLVAGAYEA